MYGLCNPIFPNYLGLIRNVSGFDPYVINVCVRIQPWICSLISAHTQISGEL